MGVGSILLERGLIDESQLERAIEEQNRTGERLDHVMVRLGMVSGAEVLDVIGQQFAMPIVDLNAIEVDEHTLRLLPPKLVFKQRCVPIGRTDGTLRVATCDPFELTAFDELRLLTGMAIELVLADERDIRKFIRTHYGVAGDTLDALAGQPQHRREAQAPGRPAVAARQGDRAWRPGTSPSCGPRGCGRRSPARRRSPRSCAFRRVTALPRRGTAGPLSRRGRPRPAGDAAGKPWHPPRGTRNGRSA